MIEKQGNNIFIAGPGINYKAQKLRELAKFLSVEYATIVLEAADMMEQNTVKFGMSESINVVCTMCNGTGYHGGLRCPLCNVGTTV